MKLPQSPVSIELFAYPWDIVDTGPTRFAGECTELGVTRLHVTTLYHSGKFLLPRNYGRRVFFAEGGTAYVPLSVSALGNMAPALSPLAQAGWLDELAKHGIPLSAWTVFHHNSRLGGMHPQLTVRNVFGDPYPFALCPSHEAVRDYSVALAKEIADLGHFTTLDLETIGYLGYVHGHHHEVAAGPLGPLENFLLSLCFCDACRSSAAQKGVAIDDIAAQTRELLHLKLQADDSNSCNTANAEQITTLIAQSPDLAGLIRMRLDTVTGLVERIAAEINPITVAPFTSSFVGSPSNIWMEGVSLSGLAKSVETFHPLAYTPDSGAVNDDLLFCLSQLKDPGKLNLTLNLGLPITPTLADAMAKVLYAKTLGVRRFSFFNYGFLGESRLKWIGELASALDVGKTASSQG